MAFISEIAQGSVIDSLNQRGDFKHVVFSGEGSMEITFDFLLDGELFDYFISFSDRGIVEEKLNIGGYLKLIERKLGGIKISKEPEERSISAWTSGLYVYKSENAKILESNKYLSSWRSYNFITSGMRKTYSAKRNLILDKNGGNLAQVLLSLHNERPKIFDKIENMLKQAIPQIDELLTPLTEGGDTYVAIREKGFDSPFDYFQVSDGTLRLLAYITVIASIEPKLICFEEPENFIHPQLFELLVEILKKSDKQIILSTHSPYLVDLVEPEDVIIVEKRDKETVAKRIKEVDKLKKHLEEIGLGELLYSGEVGGVL